MRAVETLSIFGPLSFGTGAQHSIEEYPDCGQFQLFEPLSNTWSRRKLGSQREMKDLQKCLNKSPTRSTVCKTMIVWLRECHPQEAINKCHESDLAATSAIQEPTATSVMPAAICELS